MDKTYRENFLKAGKMAGEVRKYGSTLITVGASYNDVVSKIRTKIAELDGVPAFPPQIAINETAAHYIPGPNEDVIFDDTMVVSLDVGVSYNGAIGDCAMSIDLTPDNKYSMLIEASQSALEAVEKYARAGMSLGDVGRLIEDSITSRGFEPVRNLSGHGLGEYIIHTKPTIPNYDNESGLTLEPGMTFAVEPFATNGIGLIHEVGESHIFSLVTKKGVRSPAAKLALRKIEGFKGLPFSTHDLLDAKLPMFKVKIALRELLQSGIIQSHPPLVEQEGGIVTQAENTFLVDEDGSIIITTKL